MAAEKVSVIRKTVGSGEGRLRINMQSIDSAPASDQSVNLHPASPVRLSPCTPVFERN